MNTKDNVLQVKRLSSDSEFYNNVFKKVEKISSVVFYILSFKKDNAADSLLVDSLQKKSFKAHELSLAALHATEGQTAVLSDLQQALLSLASSIEIAAAAREIPARMGQVIQEQIDGVIRYLNHHYMSDEGVSLESLTQVVVTDTKSPSGATKSRAAGSRPTANRQSRVSVPSGDISSDAYLVYSQLNDRTERIKTVLEAKPQATVKDIAEIITDVSEKTIQRDLNSLIEKGQVVREGERRWSKYSVVKDN